MKKNFFSTKFLSLLLIFGITLSPISNYLSINVYAESPSTNNSITNQKNGWYNSNGKKVYYINGKKVTSRTKKINNKIYLFDEKGYLLTNGYNTINGKKYYSDKDGNVMCNKWLTQKTTKSGNIYYYADSTGKVTEYKFKKKNNTYCLYVNNRLSKSEDLPLTYTFDISQYLDTSKYTDLAVDTLNDTIEGRCGYFKVGSHFYHLSYSVVEKCVVCDEVNKTKYDSYNCANNTFYDLGSKKELGNIIGLSIFNSKGYITDGCIFNASKKIYYYIKNGELEESSKTYYPLIFTEYDVKLNSVGGVDYTLRYANNSGKTINYVYFYVSVINRVGDTVNDTISNKDNFILKDTGPYAPGDVSSGTWEAFMYNYSANQIVIDKIEIIYNDSTSQTITFSHILDLYGIFKNSINHS